MIDKKQVDCSVEVVVEEKEKKEKIDKRWQSPPMTSLPLRAEMRRQKGRGSIYYYYITSMTTTTSIEREREEYEEEVEREDAIGRLFCELYGDDGIRDLPDDYNL